VTRFDFNLPKFSPLLPQISSFDVKQVQVQQADRRQFGRDEQQAQEHRGPVEAVLGKAPGDASVCERPVTQYH